MIYPDWNKKIYDLYQSLREGIELVDTYSLDATFRKLEEKTVLKIHLSQAKWLGYNDQYKCNIYIIELDLKEKPEWME